MRVQIVLWTKTLITPTCTKLVSGQCHLNSASVLDCSVDIIIHANYFSALQMNFTLSELAKMKCNRGLPKTLSLKNRDA
jgi:hypothetical protein